jgi:hypothetical protein
MELVNSLKSVPLNNAGLQNTSHEQSLSASRSSAPAVVTVYNASAGRVLSSVM